jgi:hypothetical protein
MQHRNIALTIIATEPAPFIARRPGFKNKALVPTPSAKEKAYGCPKSVETARDEITSLRTRQLEASDCTEGEPMHRALHHDGKHPHQLLAASEGSKEMTYNKSERFGSVDGEARGVVKERRLANTVGIATNRLRDVSLILQRDLI